MLFDQIPNCLHNIPCKVKTPFISIVIMFIFIYNYSLGTIIGVIIIL